MIDKEVKKTVDLIIDKVGKEKFIKMQEMVFKLGPLIAVRDTNNSTDFDELAQSIYESKEKCIDIPAIRRRANMSALDMLDNLAKDETKKKETSSVEEMQCTDEQKQEVDQYVESKEKFLEAQAVLGQHESKVRDIGSGWLSEKGMKGEFTKSVVIRGSKSKVRVTQSDKFSVKGGDCESDLKEVLGEKYDKCFEKERIVKIKKDILSNPTLLNTLIQKVGENDFAKYFDVTYKLKTKKGFDNKQYDLNKEERTKIKPFVSQAKPGITVI